MQLLCRYDVADFDRWRRAFDDQDETRAAAGLTLLQMWRDADAPGRAWCLYRASDEGKARDHAGDPRTALQAGMAGVNAFECHLLRTA